MKIRQNINALQLQIDNANAAIVREREAKETLQNSWKLSENEKQSAQINLKREREKNEELNIKIKIMEPKLEAMKAAHKTLLSQLTSNCQCTTKQTFN